MLVGCDSETRKEEESKQTSAAKRAGKVLALTEPEYKELLRRSNTPGNSTQCKVFYSISGVVLERKVHLKENSSDIRLRLRPWQDSKVEVECCFAGSTEQIVSAIPLGKKITVAGALFYVSDLSISLEGCSLVK